MQSPIVALISRVENNTDSVSGIWRQYSGIAELKSAPPADIVILGKLGEELDELLSTLRADSNYQFALIYILDQQETTSHPLCDGPVPAREEDMIIEWGKVTKRLGSFNRGRPPERFDERIMAWLWSRPHATLTAVRDTAAPQMYRYPLISALANDDPINDMVWLRLMVEQGWLEAGELIDRIRHCLQCNSARLNYVDTCPQCNALDITRQPALHCFTCGHVAPQQNFLKDELLLCPNCLTRLRHIGSDYDRPLENMSCKACDNSFIDAEVKARCLDCDQSHQPDELRIREIRHYSLTPGAHLRCRQGFSDEYKIEYFERLNLLGLGAFTNLLDWQIQQARRYAAAPKCSLLGLRFNQLDLALNTVEGQATMDGIIERIKETIRDTDRCSRSREDLLWFLLPHTDREGVEVLRHRLSGLTNLMETQPSSSLQVRMASLTLPDDLLAQEDARLMMGRLAGEVS